MSDEINRSMSETCPLLASLYYITESPPEEYGGFHPKTVEIAREAAAEIASLRAANERLRAECEASRSVSLASTVRRLLRGSASATSKMIDDADNALIEATAHEDAARRAVDEAGDLR